MNVLMVGVDKASKGGMLTVVENYLSNQQFCDEVGLRYVASVARGNKLKKIGAFLKAMPKIRGEIKKNHIDIVHVHMAERGSIFREGYIVKVAKKMGCKTIIHMHAATIEEWYARQSAPVKKITENVLSAADKVLVLGENWLPFMNRLVDDPNKVKTLYNAVHVPERNFYNKDGNEILFYGMLIPRKGIDDLLTAFRNILPQIPENITLALYGDDYDSKEKIGDKLARFHLGERAQYRGWLTPERKADAYKNVIVNILPSYNEGLPMTILETMAYGIPNISTNVAAIPEAIDDGGNGIIITPGRVDELASAMLEMINSVEKRVAYSESAYQKARECFSLEKHFSDLIALYESLLE